MAGLAAPMDWTVQAGCGQKIPAFVSPYPVVCLVTLNISSGLHRVNGGSDHLQVVVFYLTESPACSFGDSCGHPRQSRLFKKPELTQNATL